MSNHCFCEEIPPNVQTNPSLMELDAVSSHPVASSLGEETDPRLPTTSFRRPVESGEVRPEPPFLQANTTSSPQDLRARLAATWMPVGFRVNNQLGSLPLGPAFGPLAVPGILECPLAKGLLPQKQSSPEVCADWSLLHDERN